MGFFAFLTRNSSDRSLNNQTPRNAPVSRQSTISSFRKSRLSISRSVQELRGDCSWPTESQHLNNAPKQDDIGQQRLQQQHGQQWHTSPGHTARPSTASVADDAKQLRQDGFLRYSSGHAQLRRLSTMSTNNHYNNPLVQRTTSVRSAQTLRSKDLLDAQGEVCPSDFRARLAASGGRDYGEDVADRNIGQNGVILSSSPVKRFYETRRTPDGLRASQMAPWKTASMESITEQTEGSPMATNISSARRPLSRTASARADRPISAMSTRTAASGVGSRSTERQPASVAKSIRSRSSLASIGQPKLAHGVHAPPPVAEESEDSACPPTVRRYRDAEDVVKALQQTQHDVEDLALPASPESPIWRRAQLPIDNISLWGTPQIRLERETAARQSSMLYHGHNPVRRNWSIASTAPTTEGSETSSVLNIRSQSRCTANTSVDLESLPETDEEATEKELPRFGLADAHLPLNCCETDMSYTTDGSDIDSFIEKRRRRAIPDGEALIFNEVGFQNGGGALPGLFDQLKELIPSIPTPVAEEPEQSEEDDEDYEGESNFSVRTPESANGVSVPGLYLTQRQRMLALGFDYDTEDEELAGLESDTCEAPEPARKKCVTRLAVPSHRTATFRSEEDRKNDDTKAKMALTLRREVKKYKRSSVKPRRILEVDGNLADVE